MRELTFNCGSSIKTLPELVTKRTRLWNSVLTIQNWPSRSILPAPSEYLVQSDSIDKFGQMGGNQSLLGAIERTLGVEHIEVVVNPFVIARLGKEVAGSGSLDQCLLRRQLLVDGAALGQSVGHLAKAGLYRLLILSDGDIPINLGHLQLRRTGSSVKDREYDLRGEGPDVGPGFKETRHLVAADSGGADQDDARKESRPRCANVGIETLELVFGLEDIGTPQQHGGRET